MTKKKHISTKKIKGLYQKVKRGAGVKKFCQALGEITGEENGITSTLLRDILDEIIGLDSPLRGKGKPEKWENTVQALNEAIRKLKNKNSWRVIS